MLLDGRKSASDPNDRYYKLVLPIIPEFEEILNRLPTAIDQDDFIFKSISNKPLNKLALPRQWKNACDKASVEYKPLYECIRHAGATNLLNHGMNLDDVREMCGHTDSRTTERYAKSDTFRLKDALIRARKQDDKEGKVLHLPKA